MNFAQASCIIKTIFYNVKVFFLLLFMLLNADNQWFGCVLELIFKIIKQSTLLCYVFCFIFVL
ncbi:MAG: hypothetical protein BGO42_02650 [Flavobacterium sp. 40-81]|nr:MAG: hypothetical protein ABS44_22890 [Chryseobacterium sp. SCN 40-13]OJV68750.1 MAG: hypothetical protein BGO42_02650 [Flavobacterium sp. 40-81]